MEKSTPTPIIIDVRRAVKWLRSTPNQPISPKLRMTAEVRGITDKIPNFHDRKKNQAIHNITPMETKILVIEDWTTRSIKSFRNIISPDTSILRSAVSV